MSNNNRTAVTPKFRMAFPNLITPGTNLNNEKEWSVTALFPVDADLTSLKKAEHAAKTAKWGKDERKWPNNIASPYTDGNTKGKIDSEGEFQVYEGYADTVVVNFKRKVITKRGENTPPAVVMANPNIEAKEEDVYGGRWAKAVVNAFAYEFAGKKGVSFGLNHVQILDHDTQIGGAPRHASAYFDNEETGENTAAKSFLD